MSSVSQLISGADCGPSNPLQGLTKTFDRDRSLTQDATTSRAGPSRGAFRTVVRNPQMDDAAASFFSPSPQPPISFTTRPGPPIPGSPALHPGQAWDMSAMSRAIPAGAAQDAAAAWASDFMRSSPHTISASGSPALRSGGATPILGPPQSRVEAFSNRQMQKRPDFAQGLATPPWAADFREGNAQVQARAQAAAQMQSMAVGEDHARRVLDGQFGAWVPPMQGMDDMARYNYASPPNRFQIPIQPQEPFHAPSARTEARFVSPEPVASAELARDPTVEADDLAATASLLLESVKTETNPKFKNSAFMSLMHQLKDRTAVVEGNDIVEVPASQAKPASSTSTSAASAWTPARGDDVTQGSASVGNVHDGQAQQEWKEHPGVSDVLSGIDPTWAQWSQLMPGPSTSLYPEILQTTAEDLHEYQRPEEQARARRKSVHFDPESSFAAQEREWDTLLDQWDVFEAGQAQIAPVEEYRFQEDNPYARGHHTTRHHAMHTSADWAHQAAEVSASSASQSVAATAAEAEATAVAHALAQQTVLEMEAAVQREPYNAFAWYELGVKQQENEREQKAIQALRRAVDLDSEFIDAWLALAVSLVNENDRRAAYDAIESWIEKNPQYRGIQKPTSTVPSNTQTMAERQQLLMEQLIAMARAMPAGQIDADVQVALGVLFNVNEDYEKAIDCFHAALDVRRDDWQLYNRIGASFANSGNAEKALEYYRHALQLNPGYIRARYNLGIAEINLKHYTEAAQHILDALVLQESEANAANERDQAKDDGAAFAMRSSRGVMSSALWDGLRSASAKMRRPDLVTLCDQQDLEAYRVYFAPQISA